MSPTAAAPTVRELMQREVVTVTPRTTVGQLMRILSRHDISGVPVVDEGGSVVGVVSATDVMRLAEWPDAAVGPARRADEGARNVPTPPGSEAPLTLPGEPGGYFRVPEGSAWHFPLEKLPMTKARLETTPVEEIMTPATFHVRPDATLGELARFLVRSNVHRALVLEGSRVKGVITSMDVVRAVAADEAR
jgi:CBS domain-containing protein